MAGRYRDASRDQALLLRALDRGECCRNDILRGRRWDACSGPPRPRSVEGGQRCATPSSIRRRGGGPQRRTCIHAPCQPVPIGALALGARLASHDCVRFATLRTATLFGNASCALHKALSWRRWRE